MMVNSTLPTHLFAKYNQDPTQTVHGYSGLSSGAPAGSNININTTPSYHLPAIPAGDYKTAEPADLTFPSYPPESCTTADIASLTPEGVRVC